MSSKKHSDLSIASTDVGKYSTTTITNSSDGRHYRSVTHPNTQTVVSSSRGYSDSSVIRFLGAVLLVILLINLFFSLSSSSNSFTFERLLNVLGNMSNDPVYSTLINLRIPPITEDWGLLNVFRNFINYQLSAINTLLFLVGGIATILVTVYYFFAIIFS